MTTGQRTYTVTGMSCGHCAVSVREEVVALPGVERVDVDLNAGRLSVAGAGFSDEQVEAAVASAGYELAAHAQNAGADGHAGD